MTAASVPPCVLVIGAGTMGRGIAQVAAQAGDSVRLFDVDAALAQAAVKRMAASLARRVAKGKLSEPQRAATLARVQVVASLRAAAAGIDLAIEAVPENMALKVKVLSEVAAAAPPSALLASNTSSLSITELGQRLGFGERCIGMHFFNPPPAMPLLELVVGLHTAEATLQRAQAFAERTGKSPIVVNDSPGFASSRLGVALGAEAIRMLQTGVASVQDIDRAMELGYRHPMGPLKLTDLVGL
ncbi:MAG TPA: 3-hydroxyacyl-CoA dehydrogenase family protein, partial [Sorangium sp.]|nr:3-hydroxyacyl-CoA dehydrogenase family protein [Sorangium sp.]